MIDVADGANVDVRFRSVKFLFCHVVVCSDYVLPSLFRKAVLEIPSLKSAFARFHLRAARFGGQPRATARQPSPHSLSPDSPA
jgi:hypothetical protein